MRYVAHLPGQEEAMTEIRVALVVGRRRRTNKNRAHDLVAGLATNTAIETEVLPRVIPTLKLEPTRVELLVGVEQSLVGVELLVGAELSLVERRETPNLALNIVLRVEEEPGQIAVQEEASPIAARGADPIAVQGTTPMVVQGADPITVLKAGPIVV